MDKRWHVYVLRDPRDGVIRYVGITHKLSVREYHHRKTFDHNPQKTLWTVDLALLGMSPKLEVVATFDTKKEAEKAELRLVVLTQASSPGQLFNAEAVLSDRGNWNYRITRPLPSSLDRAIAASLVGVKFHREFNCREAIVVKRFPELAASACRALYQTPCVRKCEPSSLHHMLRDHSVLEVSIKRLVRKHIFAS